MGSNQSGFGTYELYRLGTANLLIIMKKPNNGRTSRLLILRREAEEERTRS